MKTLQGELIQQRYYDTDLQKIPSTDIQNAIKAPVVFEISRLEGPVLLNNVKAYRVRWLGYKKASDITIEKRSDLFEIRQK